MLSDMKLSCARPSIFSWADALSKVMFNWNTDYHSNTKTTAFNITFGQIPNTGKSKKITDLSNSEDYTFDSYDRVVKKGSVVIDSDFTLDSYDRVKRRSKATDEFNN